MGESVVDLALLLDNLNVGLVGDEIGIALLNRKIFLRNLLGFKMLGRHGRSRRSMCFFRGNSLHFCLHVIVKLILDP